MAKEQDLRDAIANLEAILNSGAQTVAQDGHTTVFDLKEARTRLEDLKRELAECTGKKPVRPFFTRIRLD
tara:strand:+ start:434 stop:643 length:210 start_codon:yes stop_codon:yes gene_type:complete